jgi:hypothetical protein
MVNKMNKMRTTRNTIIIGMFLLHTIVAAGWAGELVHWGQDRYGAFSNTPAGDDFVAVSASESHCIAVKSNGSLVSWGLDDHGQVSNTPEGNDFEAVAAGNGFSVAVKSDGSLVVWGDDSYGQVSDIPAGSGFAAVSAGDGHCVAMKSDGSLVAWGNNNYGQVLRTPAGNDFAAVAAGDMHNVALRSGSLVAWGYDYYGGVYYTPAGNDFVAVAAGLYHNVALKSDGSLVTWGYDGNGLLSNVPAGNDFVAVAAGDAHSVALKSDGSLVAWGFDSYGSVSNTPAGNNFTAVAAGSYYNVAIRGIVSPDTYTLTTNVSPSGSGSVTTNPDRSSYSSNELVQLTAIANPGYTFRYWGGDASGSLNPITIIMDSNKSVRANFEPTVSIAATDASAGETAANNGSFTVSRTGATSASLRVFYSTTGSTASSGTDYAALPGYVDIPSGQSSALISVVVIDDDAVEDSETVRLTITDVGQYIVGSPSNATVTISDNDYEQPEDEPIVTITAPDASAGEPANDGYFRISRTGDTASSLRVYYSTSGSTASAGTDYAALYGYVYIPYGQSSVDISVAVNDDNTVEDSETVDLTIGSNSAYTVGSPSNATVTITDDDNEQPQDEPIVTITAPDASAGEPANDGYFRVSRTGATSGSLRVYYSTSGSTASSGTDYAALTGSVDIPSGQSSALVSVAVNDDNTVENSETVDLTISSNSAYTIGSPSNATVTITDNDIEQPEDEPIVTITAPDASAAEPGNNGSFRISRTATSGSLRVYYSTSGSTASSGTDYAALAGSVDIPSGQSSALVSVAVNDDNTVENSETVRLTISSNSAYTIGSPSSATVTIADDDEDVPDPPVVAAEQMMVETLNFFYQSVADGSLVGVGKGKGKKELNSLKNMLETALQRIQGGYYQEACGQLSAALSRCDGYNDPPDYVSGGATVDLARMIRDVINELGCE